MSTGDSTPAINLAEIQAEIGKMSNEDIQASLLKLRVRQKTQQKKQQGSASQKAYQLRQREKNKMLKQKAIELGLWDDINEKAEAAAEEELKKSAAEDVDVEDEAA